MSLKLAVIMVEVGLKSTDESAEWAGSFENDDWLVKMGVTNCPSVEVSAEGLVDRQHASAPVLWSKIGCRQGS